MLRVEDVVRVALLLLLDEPCFCRVAVETNGQIGDLLYDVVVADLFLRFLQLGQLKGN